ncbi:MAG: hypothetical protein ACKVVT_01840 [Dehalococcoidia bacterium]
MADNAIGLPGPAGASAGDGGELLTIRVSRETAAQLRALALRWGVHASMRDAAGDCTTAGDVDRFDLLAELFAVRDGEVGA